MISVLRRRKKSPPGASSSQSHASTSCTSTSVNIPSIESFQSAPLVVPSNLELQIEPIQPNQSSSTAPTETRAKRGHTRGKGLRKMNKAIGEKLKINIVVEKGRPINRVQSTKLSN